MEGNSVRGRGRTRRFRWVLFGVLAALCMFAAVLARHRERAALDVIVAQAQMSALDHANAALSGVRTNDVSRPMVGPTYREVIVPVQAEAMTDPRVARVRIWSTDGTLLFSTDERETIGRVRLADDLALSTAIKGRTTSHLIIAPYRAATVGAPAQDTELFQTFSPLHVADRVSIQGVVETDQFWDPMVSASSRPWRILQWAAIALSALFGLVTMIAFRRRNMVEVAPVTSSAGLGSSQGAVSTSDQADAALRTVPGALEANEPSAQRDASLAALEQRVDVAERRALEAEHRLQLLADDVSSPSRSVSDDGSTGSGSTSEAGPTASPGAVDPAPADGSGSQAARSHAQATELRERLARTAARKKPGGVRDEDPPRDP